MKNRAAMTIGAWLRFDAIRGALALASPRRVLEIGAGQGAMASYLASRFDYTGVEPDETSFGSLQQHLAELGMGLALLGTADMAPPGPYDLVCAFEVLEHVEEDGAELGRWRDLLGPGGHLLLSVPANERLYGPIDKMVGHYRRYDRGALEALLRSWGFEIVRSWTVGAVLGHWIHSLSNLLARRQAGEATSFETASAASGRLWQPRSRLSDGFRYAMALPFRILQRPLSGTSFGTDLVVLARRSN